MASWRHGVMAKVSPLRPKVRNVLDEPIKLEHWQF